MKKRVLLSTVAFIFCILYFIKQSFSENIVITKVGIVKFSLKQNEENLEICYRIEWIKKLSDGIEYELLQIPNNFYINPNIYNVSYIKKNSKIPSHQVVVNKKGNNSICVEITGKAVIVKGPKKKKCSKNVYEMIEPLELVKSFVQKHNNTKVDLYNNKLNSFVTFGFFKLPNELNCYK